MPVWEAGRACKRCTPHTMPPSRVSPLLTAPAGTRSYRTTRPSDRRLRTSLSHPSTNTVSSREPTPTLPECSIPECSRMHRYDRPFDQSMLRPSPLLSPHVHPEEPQALRPPRRRAARGCTHRSAPTRGGAACGCTISLLHRRIGQGITTPSRDSPTPSRGSTHVSLIATLIHRHTYRVVGVHSRVGPSLQRAPSSSAPPHRQAGGRRISRDRLRAIGARDGVHHLQRVHLQAVCGLLRLLLLRLLLLRLLQEKLLLPHLPLLPQ